MRIFCAANSFAEPNPGENQLYLAEAFDFVVWEVILRAQAQAGYRSEIIEFSLSCIRKFIQHANLRFHILRWYFHFLLISYQLRFVHTKRLCIWNSDDVYWVGKFSSPSICFALRRNREKDFSHFLNSSCSLINQIRWISHFTEQSCRNISGGACFASQGGPIWLMRRN